MTHRISVYLRYLFLLVGNSDDESSEIQPWIFTSRIDDCSAFGAAIVRRRDQPVY